MSDRSEANLRRIFSTVISQEPLASRLPIPEWVTYELDCRQGRPDAVLSPDRALGVGEWDENISRVLATPSCARVLSVLKRRGRRSLAYLHRSTGLSRGVLREALRELIEEGLARECKNSTYVRGPSALPSLEMWAVEFKVKNWQRAIYQALQYRAFSHRVIILLDSNYVHRIEPHLERLHQLSVGVGAIDQERESIRTLSFPRKSTPASRFHYAIATGAFLRSISRGDRAGAIAP